ncbi:hypothetical protein LTR36_004623 [Oleoguttula mirabilis]|uniref:MIF4G domain-containing protein n=1 Tax=Oleoguttula mirabilis TaxID=1507867 RepID=A0AAV9JFZ6_9PEZI|nr:hypothetical protein LTR36_004623 [Oleoguttula mirabilis]
MTKVAPASVLAKQRAGDAIDQGAASGHMAPDEVERKVRKALDDMTPENFDEIFRQIEEIVSQAKSETDGRTLREVVRVIFEEACNDGDSTGIYAQLCLKMLKSTGPEIRDESLKDRKGKPVAGAELFRKYLLGQCQEAFERGPEISAAHKAVAASRRALGLTQFVGELYKTRMLTIRTMHECVLRLMEFDGEPDSTTVERLVTLLRTVGATMSEDAQGCLLLATYIQRIDEVLLKCDSLPSRSRSLILDLNELRKAGWKVEGSTNGHDAALTSQAV